MDAAKCGMRGVWFPPGPPATNSIQPLSSHALQQPILWHTHFPEYIQKMLVSQTNPSGTITNSDLELALTIAHDNILTNTTSVAHLYTCSLTDNTPAQACVKKAAPPPQARPPISFKSLRCINATIAISPNFTTFWDHLMPWPMIAAENGI